VRKPGAKCLPSSAGHEGAPPGLARVGCTARSGPYRRHRDRGGERGRQTCAVGDGLFRWPWFAREIREQARKSSTPSEILAVATWGRDDAFARRLLAFAQSSPGYPLRSSERPPPSLAALRHCDLAQRKVGVIVLVGTPSLGRLTAAGEAMGTPCC